MKHSITIFLEHWMFPCCVFTAKAILCKFADKRQMVKMNTTSKEKKTTTPYGTPQKIIKPLNQLAHFIRIGNAGRNDGKG